MLDPLLDALFPRRCVGCGRGGWPFCAVCREELVALGRPWCERCGRPTDRPALACLDCPPPDVAIARSAFLFRGPARRAVHRLKFGGWRQVAEALGEAMAVVAPPGASAVCWVPLARGRRAGRGYDQAHALAEVVGRGLRLPVLPLVARRSATPPQARRGGAERRSAMLKVFRPGPEPPPPRVLLVDDVLTTGATAAACARVLREAGAHRVALLTAARAVSGRLPAHCYTRASDPRPGLRSPGDDASPHRDVLDERARRRSMDLVLKGRGYKITEHDRAAVARKLERLSRMERRAVRLEVEIIAENNPRINGSRRLEAALSIPRKTFRASADGPDVDRALDLLVERLERQIRDHHGRRRTRTVGAGNRLESPAPPTRSGTQAGEDLEG